MYYILRLVKIKIEISDFKHEQQNDPNTKYRTIIYNILSTPTFF